MKGKVILMRTCLMTLYIKTPVMCSVSLRFHLFFIAFSVLELILLAYIENLDQKKTVSQFFYWGIFFRRIVKNRKN